MALKLATAIHRDLNNICVEEDYCKAQYKVAKKELRAVRAQMGKAQEASQISELPHLSMNSTKRVTPTTFVQQIPSPKFRLLSDLGVASDTYIQSLPKLINYDIFEKKTSQQLLYESAQERTNPEKKWKEFINELETHIHSKKYSKDLVKHLDETKEWAALHYAVFNGNTYVCNQLTDPELGQKQFRCDINILTGDGENVLHIAARSNYLWQPSTSSKSIEAIVPIEGKDVPLPEIILALIKRRVKVNHPNDEGRTPLHLAVMESRLPMVKYLLQNGAELYATTIYNANVLHFTFIPNNETEPDVAAMFEYLRGKIGWRNTGWRFPWGNQRTNLVQMRTLENRTPLVLAICHPEMSDKIIGDLLKYMRENSEDSSDQSSSSESNNSYQTQIFMAIGMIARRKLRTYNHLGPLREVCNRKTFNQLLHFPCRYDNVELLAWLITNSSNPNDKTTIQRQTFKGLDLNTKDHAGYTPLLTAAFYGATACVEYLLKYVSSSVRNNTTNPSLSVDICQTNSEGENILHICAKHPVSQDSFDKVWDSAAKSGLPQQRDNTGNLPLHTAAGNNQVDMCKKLLTAFKWSVDPLKVKNHQGQTAAHVATEAVPHRIGPERHFVEKHERDKHHSPEAKKKDEEDDDEDEDHDFGLPIIKLFWQQSAKDDPHGGLFEKDDDRKTCLHLAAAKGHLKIVKFLVGIVHLEIDDVAAQRLTPLHMACENGHGEVIAYLIENGASPLLRTSQLYNSLEVAIINQNTSTVRELLTLPNWRELMCNAQPIHKSEAFDTPMRKLIRYLPKVAVWLIEEKLTRTVGGQGKHVFRKVYDYEFYMDVYQVKKWYQQGAPVIDEEESFSERCHRRGCTAICCYSCCCQKNQNGVRNQVPYTDDAYTLIRNHPLFIASEQSQYPALVEHPYNTFLRAQWYRQNGRLFYVMRGISFLLYAAFLAVWTTIVLLGKHPQYFYDKAGRNMTLDLDSCANLSRAFTAANDPEALKNTTYKNLKFSLYAFLILFVVQNLILILALFPRVFRTIDYILEISAFVLTFVYIYDWTDWQAPILFRCPVQYQLGSMGLLLAWISMLSYVKRTTWFDMGIFVVMIQLIGSKFIRFVPILLIIVCGFGFTHWMLLQNQTPFQTPVEAVIRTGLLMFDLGYESHLYDNTIYYQIIYVITILSAIVFCIFILNLLISVAVGEIPSLTVQGKIWQSQMLYDLLSDYSIISMQMIRFLDFISCGHLSRWLFRKQLRPIFILEHNQKDNSQKKAWKYVQMNFFDEKIQDDIVPNTTSDGKE